MFFLLVNLYEFGQFLRILLWISVPMFIVAMLVTTWLHYRRRRRTQDDMSMSMHGLELSASPEILLAAMRGVAVVDGVDGESAVSVEREAIGPEDAIENMYKGIRWMKEKYEQYRDLSDQRIEELKEQVVVLEKKYQDLLAALSQAPTPDGGPMDNISQQPDKALQSPPQQA